MGYRFSALYRFRSPAHSWRAAPTLARQISRQTRLLEQLTTRSGAADTQLRDLMLPDVPAGPERDAEWARVKAEHEFTFGGFTGSYGWVRRVQAARMGSGTAAAGRS